MAGHEVASIRLEMLWNKLAVTHEFSLLCGYAIGKLYKMRVFRRCTTIIRTSSPPMDSP
jgi:hypothetical protein